VIKINNLDNKKFDKEYSTSWTLEYLYLKECGIKYTFVKKCKDGITTWKYEKNSELFLALYNFYKKIGKQEK